MDKTFPLLGEPLALDLLNTVVRTGLVELDLIRDAEAFTNWRSAQLARLSAGPYGESKTKVNMAAVRSLRTDIRLLFDALGEEQPPGGVLERVNELAAHGAPQLRWATPRPALTRLQPAGEDPVLIAAAVSAVELLGSPGAGIRPCANPTCTLLFHDPGGRRQWCSSASCGNRARAARHYARQHPR